jgi:hypothetical protein
MLQTITQTVSDLPKLQGIVREIELAIAAPLPKEEVSAIYTINDLLLERTRTIPDQPLVGYPSSTRSAGDYVYYSATELSRFADGAVQNLNEQGLPIVCLSFCNQGPFANDH